MPGMPVGGRRAPAPRRARLMPLTLACAATLAGGLAPAAQAQDAAEPRVTAVDLGQSGVALLTLSATAEDGAVTLAVPREQASDVLGSLVVRDPGGSVVALRTATPATAPEALRATPFAGGAPRDVVSLLAALRGVEVSVLGPDGSGQGVVMGVASRERVVGETVAALPVVLLLGAEGAREVPLGPGTQVDLPEGVTGPLRAAGEAERVSGDRQSFELELEAAADASGGAARDLSLSYVTAAPAWRNSWRLLLDEGRLQGWATVENLSGRDWRDVELTLTTGAPVAYERDLITPRRPARLAPPDLIGGPPEVRADEGFAPARAAEAEAFDQAAPAPAPMASAADVVAMEAAPSGFARPAEEARGLAAVRYTVPGGVDLGAGRTANLPYLDVAIEPEVVALYQPSLSSGVVLAARLEADRPLAPGLVSVRDAQGFVGDAPFEGLSAGQARLLPYAAAPGAVVAREDATLGTLVDVAAAEGALRLEVVTQSRTTYEAELPEGVASFAVEHPKGAGDLVRATGEVEERADLVRVTSPVEDGRARVEIVEERVEAQLLELGRDGLRQVLATLATGGARPAEEDRAAIDAAARAMAALDAAEREARRLEARYAVLAEEQSRLRENLRAVSEVEGDPGLRRRYEAGLAETEDEIAGLLEEIRAAQTAVAGAQDALDAAIAALR